MPTKGKSILTHLYSNGPMLEVISSLLHPFHRYADIEIGDVCD